MNSLTVPFTLAAILAMPRVSRAQTLDPGAITEPTLLEPVRIQPTPQPPIRYYVPPPRPVREPIPRRRAEFGITVDYVRLPASSYNQAVALWGYSGFFDALQLSTHALAAVKRWFLVGGRVGYLYVNGGRATFDSAALDAHVGDVSAVARFQIEWPGSQVVGRAGIDLDAGPAFGSIVLRGTASGFASVRLAATAFIGFGARARLPAIVFRLGAQYLPHEGPVMGSGSDSVFAGGIFGTAIEAPL